MLTRIILELIRFYRTFISPLTLPSCRFFPTCSAYALEAVERFGPGKGLILAAWRILRCHPFHPGGFDPVLKPPASPADGPSRSLEEVIHGKTRPIGSGHFPGHSGLVSDVLRPPASGNRKAEACCGKGSPG